MKIHLIVAITAQGVIGNKKGLPWHIPEDQEDNVRQHYLNGTTDL